MCTDVLALLIDQALERQKALVLIQKSIGIENALRSEDDILNSSITGKEFTLIRSIAERLQKGSLPYVNEEGLAEFPTPVSSLPS